MPIVCFDHTIDSFRHDRTFARAELNDRLWSLAAEIAAGPHLGTENWLLNGDKGSLSEVIGEKSDDFIEMR